MSKTRDTGYLNNIIQYSSSSVSFVSGSTVLSSINTSGNTKYGITGSNTHQFTGSLSITGSLAITTAGIEFQVNPTGVNLGNALTDSHIISGSLRVNPNGLFVSSSGNVGIGTTNPLSLLDVSVLANGARRLLVNYADSLVTIKSANDTSTAENLRVWGDNIFFYTGSAGSGGEAMRLTSTGRVGIGRTSPGTALSVAGKSEAWQLALSTDTGAGAVIGSPSADVLAFGNWAGTERMRITSGGNLLFTGGVSTGVTDTKFLMISQGTTSSTYAIVAKQSNNSTNLFALRDDGLFQTGLATNSPYNASISGRSAVIDSSGTLGYTSSTRESKTNIEQLSNVSWIYELNPVSFNYRKKDDENNYTDEAQEEKWYGLIADEVESVNQDLVFYNIKEDGTKTLAGVEYNKLISSLVKAIQELKAENDTLKEILQRNNIQ